MAIDFTPTAPPTGGINFSPNSPTPTAPAPSLADSIWGGLGAVGNFVAGGASDLGTHLGQMAAGATADAAGALGFKGEQDKINSRLAAGQNNVFGAPVKTLQGGTTGLKQLTGDTLKTGAEAGAILTAPASIPAAIGVGAGIGAAQAGGDALQQDASLTDIAKQVGTGAAIGGATGGVLSGVGQLLGKLGDKTINWLVKPSAADMADGYSPATLKEFNLGGNIYQIQDKTQNALTDLSSQLREKLGSSDATINLQDVYKQAVEQVQSQGSKLKSFGANTRIDGALSQLGNEVNAVHEAGGLSIPDAQMIKQAAGQFGSWQYGKVDPDSKASELVYNAFYNKLKTAIEDNSPEGVKEINQQISKLIPVSNAILRRIPVAERQAPISLTDFIGLTASTFEPHALGLTALNFLSKNGRVANVLSQHAATAANTLAPYASFLGGNAISGGSDTSSPQPQP